MTNARTDDEIVISARRIMKIALGWMVWWLIHLNPSDTHPRILFRRCVLVVIREARGNGPKASSIRWGIKQREISWTSMNNGLANGQPMDRQISRERSFWRWCYWILSHSSESYFFFYPLLAEMTKLRINIQICTVLCEMSRWFAIVWNQSK